MLHADAASGDSTHILAHRPLVSDLLEEAHGPLAAALFNRLCDVGPATLCDLADYIRERDPFNSGVNNLFGAARATVASTINEAGSSTSSSSSSGQGHRGGGGPLRPLIQEASDRQVKTTMSVLLQHDLVRYREVPSSSAKHSRGGSSTSGTGYYRAQLGRALLVLLHPCFVRFLRGVVGRRSSELAMALFGLTEGSSSNSLSRQPLLPCELFGDTRSSSDCVQEDATDASLSLSTLVVADATDRVLALLRRYGRLPLPALERDIARTNPALLPAAQLVLQSLTTAGVIVPAVTAPVSAAATNSASAVASSQEGGPERKRARTETNTPAANTSTTMSPNLINIIRTSIPHTFHPRRVLSAMRRSSVRAFLSTRYDGISMSIIDIVLAADAAAEQRRVHHQLRRRWGWCSSLLNTVSENEAGNKGSGASNNSASDSSFAMENNNNDDEGEEMDDDRNNNFRLSSLSAPITVEALYASSAHFYPDTVIASKIQELCCSEWGGPLQKVDNLLDVGGNDSIDITLNSGTNSSRSGYDDADDPFRLTSSQNTTGGGRHNLPQHGGAQQQIRLQLNYSRCVALQARDTCDRFLLARFGPTGVRVARALLHHGGAAEDHSLAEEVITSQPSVRETLLAMAVDGFVRQLEVPKGVPAGTSSVSPSSNAAGAHSHSSSSDSASLMMMMMSRSSSAAAASAPTSSSALSSEHNPRHSVYLWSLSEGGLKRVVRTHLAVATYNIRTRLLYELRWLEERFPQLRQARLLLGDVAKMEVGSSNSPHQQQLSATTNDHQRHNEADDDDAHKLNGTLMHSEYEALLRARFNCRALQATQVAQLETMLEMEFY